MNLFGLVHFIDFSVYSVLVRCFGNFEVFGRQASVIGNWCLAASMLSLSNPEWCRLHNHILMIKTYCLKVKLIIPELVTVEV